MNSKVKDFKKRINQLNIWKFAEIKTCLVRLEPIDMWKVGVIRVQLLNYGSPEKKILLDHGNVKLIREIKAINTLTNFLDNLLTTHEIEILGEKVSLEYFTEQISFDFKDRAGMRNNYYVDSACYFLTRSPSNNPSALSDIEDKLRLKLRKHTKPYDDLGQVCSLLLGVRFGGAYSPQILVFAPIFIKIDQFRLEGNNLHIYLYCSKRIRLSEYSVSAFGYDVRNNSTFSEGFSNFKRMKKESERALSSKRIPSKDTAYIRLELFYEKEDYHLEEYHRPFVSSTTSNQNRTQIQKKMKQIKSIYTKAKSQSDRNEKGDLFEDVISELITTVDGLQVFEKNTDNKIEEIDLKILNNNQSGIWRQFEGIVFVECKNWFKRVASKEVRDFEGKMRNHFLHSGIFFAINGFKGRNYGEGALGQIKLRFEREGFMIIPVDGIDIENVFKTSDLSSKLDEKLIDLYQ